MRARNLILIGFMGAGKSVTGRLIAERFDLAFRDTDQLIEARSGVSIAQIYQESGEPAFRRLELQTFTELARADTQVISTGGGILTTPGAGEIVRDAGLVALLTASPSCILQRVAPVASRPLLAAAADPEQRIRELLAQRIARYLSAADVVIDTSGRPPESVADEAAAIFVQRAGASGS